MEKLNNAIKNERPLTPALIKEYNEIRSMLPANKKKKLDSLMNKAPGAYGRGKLAKEVVKRTGGAKVQRKAKQGGNPDIQKKQGFVGAMAKGGKATKKAKGMAKGGKMKSKGYAKGGKTMMKKSKGMARGGKAMMKKSKGMARGGKMMKSKGMARGGRMMKKSKGMARGGKARR
tara:strand:+ start:63 stop:584 length:522 start_codon:yes stop_codon:yes gene_type:complete